MDAEWLEEIAELDEVPTMIPVRVSPAATRWWGPYPVLVPLSSAARSDRPEEMVHGTMCFIPSGTAVEKLRYYETHHYVEGDVLVGWEE